MFWGSVHAGLRVCFENLLWMRGKFTIAGQTLLPNSDDFRIIAKEVLDKMKVHTSLGPDDITSESFESSLPVWAQLVACLVDRSRRPGRLGV